MFDVLDQRRAVPFDEIVEKLGANPGSLAIALNMLESLGWIEKTGDKYRLSQESDLHKKIPVDIIDLLSFPMDVYLSKPQTGHSLMKWIELSGKRWGLESETLALMLDGMLVIPLLLSLKEKAGFDSQESVKAAFDRLPSNANSEVFRFFQNRNWVTEVKNGNAEQSFTPVGKFILDRIFITSIAASYRPMLARISTVLFGECRTVFERDEHGNELHVDRTLNVLGSGFQHGKYFDEMAGAILPLFDNDAYEKQPKYIADMGCGDGTLLKTLYEFIKSKTARGRVLDQYPLKMIGVDYNRAAIIETGKTLKDIDHLVLHGDIGDPVAMIEDLRAAGIEDPENILHIRSFLDHDRPYIAPDKGLVEAETALADDHSVCIDADGRAIAESNIHFSLVEHFERWQAIMGKFGLIALEVHCLDPKTIRQYFDKSESFHFDTYHRFSQQLLVSAEKFLMAAAWAGLFPVAGGHKKFPKALPFSRITLNHFEKRDYRIRPAKLEDLPKLEQLEAACWSPDLRTPLETIKRRIIRYPQGQLTIRINDELAGVIYSQRLSDPGKLHESTIDSAEELHDPEGGAIQLLAVNILPEMQQQGLGDQLLEFMLQRCSVVNGIEQILGVTLCKDYANNSDLAIEEYIAKTNAQGLLADPTLRFHQIHGAKIKAVIPGYRPKDAANGGNGVLIQYDISTRERFDAGRLSKPVDNVRARDKKSIVDYIDKTIRRSLGINREHAFGRDVPLMEMGLDSADLLELQVLFSSEFGIALEPAFFFMQNTVDKIVDYFVDNIGQSSRHGSTVATATASEDVAGMSSQAPDGHSTQEPIAIVGLACRFPGGDAKGFWNMLRECQNGVREIPEGRSQSLSAISSASGAGKFGGYLDRIDTFDARFFRLSPAEAELLDPQQRLLLELTWEVFEDSGHRPSSFRNSATGVWIGACHFEYRDLLEQSSIPVSAHWATGTFGSILSNRLSYFFDLKGPSVTIDTACSSSLVALDSALRALRQGTCKQAIAGGINLICSDTNTLSFANAGMLSPTGLCQTFDAHADGYVRGEGAGLLLLKPLNQALADGDQIYGVIAGSSVNHGGQASSLTVPNPQAQSELIKSAYREAGISPLNIDYVEAHGTGTNLGDPIEITGLKKAFRELTLELGEEPLNQPYCGIGSVKTNIGHLEGAAGIAGVIKVLLSMRYGMLPGNLHFREINPHIDLTDTPFRVLSKTESWPQHSDGHPRRAGVSSFGFGGANAHVVLEEYALAPGTEQAPRAELIVLSSGTKKQLHEAAGALLGYLADAAAGGESAPRIEDLAWTLQDGREEMAERLAFVAGTLDELASKLRGFLEGREETGIYQGRVDKTDSQASILEGREGHEFLRAVVEEGRLSKLALLWVGGNTFDWHHLHANRNPRRIGLPTYSFARQRYWIPNGAGQSRTVAGAKSLATETRLHPLLHRNTSNLWGQRFSSTFSGDEFFLSDHVVAGWPMLPGVAYLELARAAIEHSAEADAGNGLRLEDVAWLRPLALQDAELEVHIGLYREDDGLIGYEIYDGIGDESGEPVIHGQGRAVLTPPGERPLIDLQALRGRCREREVSGEALYARFQDSGLNYGPAHRGLEHLYIGHDATGRSEVLARLSLPRSVADTADEYGLHPSLMDAALQAAASLSLEGAESGTTLVPFALDEVTTWSKCPAQGWAWVRHSADSSPDDAVGQYDIDLCDESGAVCVRLKGFTLRALERGSEETAGELEPGLVMLAPSWDAVAVAQGEVSPASGDSTLVIGGTAQRRTALREHLHQATLLEVAAGAGVEALKQQLEPLGEIDHIFWLAPETSADSPNEDALIEAQEQGVLQCFHLFKALAALGYERQPLSWTLITTQAQPIRQQDTLFPAHASVHGFAGSLAKEYPHWQVRLVDLPADGEWPLEALLRLPADPEGAGWGFRDGEWYRQHLLPGQLPQADKTGYRQGGVYLVIGGAGGIGEAWSEYMIRRYAARIVWIGRKTRDAAIEAKLERLAQLGPRPLYLSADAGDRQALEAAYGAVREHYGEIHGMIHSAIVLEDKSLVRMSEAAFRAALAAKVDVSVRLAQVFGGETLDFVLFFSSILSFMTPPGQSNYASGCTFKDAFAHALGQQWACPVKIMNWGYWGGAGVVATPEYQSRMADLGIGSIEPDEGMAALELLLSRDRRQLGLLKTTKPGGVSWLSRNERLFVQTQRMDSVLNALELPAEAASAPIIDDAKADVHESLLQRVLWAQLSGMGLAEIGEADFDEIKRCLGLIDFYDRWLAASLAMWVEQGRLRIQDGRYRVAPGAALDAETVWREWENRLAQWRHDPDLGALARLETESLRALPAILRGERQATDVLFPEGSMALVEGFYSNNAAADYFNNGLAGLVESFVKKRLAQDEKASIRILEIGAGTGATSAAVFDRLKPHQARIAEYCYTDLSQAFLIHARQAYSSDAPYLETRLLDIERPLAEQGLELGRYDLVIAANVLHATRNIRQTLRNAKAALCGQGLLLLNELTGESLSTHVTFGLLEGWWLFEDAALRCPGAPLLSAENWVRVLEAEGFGRTLLPLSSAAHMGQQIIVAESDGVVRQRLQAQTKTKRAVERKTPSAEGRLSPPLAESQGDLEVKTRNFIKRVISTVLNMPMEQISADEPLENYGIDSILVLRLTKELETSFGPLPKTLFFEYQNLRDLAGYFLTAHRGQLQKLLGGEATVTPAGTASRSAAPVRFQRRQRQTTSGSGLTPRGDSPSEIAIIGLSGRYAQARNVREFWNNLREGRDCIGEVPPNRWEHSRYYDSDKNRPGKTYSKWGGFIDGVDEFDPLFFGISPREAESMDPQERLFLQQAHACIEDAGYLPRAISPEQRVGVFVGVMNSYYSASAQFWSIANRVSYFFGFHGPSLAVDSACSSSLTALHLAVESLQSGASDCAIAGGVNLIVSPQHYVALASKTMLSEGNACRAFGEGADGLVDGEGVGAVLLKPLARAVADGDRIYGVIKGTALNHGGKTNGYTVPNPAIQAEVVERSLRQAGVDPRTVSYIEAHGTGTALGDPVEIAGLSRAFQHFTQDRRFCAIGSVKSNIGHCESAAGIAGLTKVLLQMAHKELAPSLHAESLNPHIDFENSPFVVQRSLEKWRCPELEGKRYPRIAGLSSFGAGGANAHVVIEEYVAPEQEAVTILPALVVLSAKNDERLREQAAQLLDAIDTYPLAESDLADMAYTLQVGREEMAVRLGFLASGMAEVKRKLSAFLGGEEGIDDLYRGAVKRNNKEMIGVFSNDEDMEQAVDAWVAKGKYAKLLELWANGLSFDWNRLYGSVRPQRIGLPTYPFATERYWLKDAGGKASSAIAQDRGLADGRSEPIAVIGISCNFPMSPDPDAFWRNLSGGRDCISEIPKERWDWQAYYGDPVTEPGKTNVKHGGFIEGMDMFDPRFFGISPREAESMDPQQRLLMTYAWKALEDAGYAAGSLAGSNTSIIAAIGNHEYSLLLGKAGIEVDGYTMTGLLPSVGPNRLSYLLDFHGPSEQVETACSSSLVAIHRAIKLLGDGECEMAIVGGVNTLLTPDYYGIFSSARMLSPDGRCKTFSKDADGYGRGEGAGILVLKRLSAAEAAGDHIYAVIRGSAVNHDGRSQSLTAPNPAAQAEVLMAAYRKAGIDPRTVSYIEAHGTGTPLGDPSEVDGLKQAFAALSENGGPWMNGYCGLGSVKTNIGHLEMASGVAGVIKVLLQLRHKTLVKSLHSEELNPAMQLDESPFYVVRERRPWEALKDSAGRELPRRASVNSFGFGGVNAHVVIEEYVAPEREPVSVLPALVVLSAKDEARLRKRAEQLLDAIEREPLGDAELSDMAYTLQLGREAMAVRLAFVAGAMAEVKHKLTAYLAGEEGIEDLYRGEAKRNSETVGLFADEDMARIIEQWVEKEKYGKLLGLWVKGVAFDWNRLYATGQPRRISLPAYPFEGERYWSGQRLEAVKKQAALLHPLLHENRSNLMTHCYVSRFDGTEWFLDQGASAGEKELPPLLALEMILAAVELATPEQGMAGRWELQDTVWGAPAMTGGQRNLTTALIARGAEAVDVEIYSGGTERANEIIHCQSHARIGHSPTPEQVDILSLMSAMGRQTEGLPPGVTAYYQDNRQALAELRLPSGRHGAGYLLPPDLLRLISQLLNRAVGEFTAPISLERLRKVFACPERGFLRLRLAPEAVHIDLCDEQGNVCLQLEGLRSRSVARASGNFTVAPSVDSAIGSDRLQLSPVEPAPEPRPQPVRTREIELPALFAHQPQPEIRFGALMKKPNNISLLPVAEVPSGPLAEKGGVTLPPFSSSASALQFGEIMQKPDNITLLPVMAAPTDSLPQKGVVKLSPLSANTSTVEAYPARLLDLGEGLFSIETDAPSLCSAIGPIVQALNAARQEDSLKALVLVSRQPAFWQGDRQVCNEATVRRLFSNIASFPYPVIAAVLGNATGAGLLLAAVCDFMVCSEEGEYGFTNQGGGLFPSAAEERLFRERLGHALTDDLLYRSLRYPGRQLHEKGWACRIVPAAQVESEAKAFAANLTQKSRLALQLLKTQLGRDITVLADGLVPVEPIQSVVPDTMMDLRNSVLVVKPGNSGSDYGLQALTAELRAAVERIGDATEYCSIMVAGGLQDFLPESPEGIDPARVMELKEVVQSAPVPVIAAFEANVSGLAWLFGLFCDAIVYRRDSRYGASPIWTDPRLSREVAALCAQRLGSSLGHEVCWSQEAYTGSRLQSRLGALTVVEGDRVMSQALSLAAFWGSWPRAVVSDWKNRQIDQLRVVVEALPEEKKWEEGDDRELLEALPSVPTEIPLRSAVVSATVYPEGIVVLAMQEREAKNMFSEALMAGLNEAFGSIRQNPAFKVVVLTGYDSYFATGGTREALLAIQQGQVSFTDDKVFELPLTCPLPVIAAIQGHAIGGGWSLGMFADLILLSEESRYLSPYMGYGFTPGAGSTLVFPKKIGYDLARETLLSAKEISGNDLKARGLTLPVLPRREVVSNAIELAGRLARQSRTRLLGLKRLWTHALHNTKDDVYRRELAMHEQTFVNNAQTRESIEAKFAADKRPAQVSAINEAPSLSAILDTLRTLLAQELFLKPEEIDGEIPFIELGLDSITGVNWVSKINAHYGTRIEATKVYSYPTLAQFSRYVREEAGALSAPEPMPMQHSIPQTVLQAAPQAAPMVEVKPLPAPQTAQAAPSLSAILDTLRTLLAQELFLKPEEIDEEIPFIELGLDSITGVNWVSKINAHYGTRIEATKVYSYPTLARFSRYVREEAGALSAPEPMPMQHSVPQTVLQAASQAATMVEVRPIQAAPAPQAAQAAPSLSAILDTLRALLAQELFLKPEEIDGDIPFIELGLDSITGVNWVSKINAHYGTRIEATKVYSHPTLAQFSRYVREEAGALSAPEPMPIQQTAPQAAPQAAPMVETRPRAAMQETLVSLRRQATSHRADLPMEEVSTSMETEAEPMSSEEAVSVPAQAMTKPTLINENASNPLQPIAVIGVAGQFPMAGNIDEFWTNLAAGRNCISEIPGERWSLNDYYKEGEPQPGKSNCKWIGQLEEYDRFDPLFFNISPTEAECMDPQQRLLLQNCWHSIENAGYNPRAFSGSQCGVFIGCAKTDYQSYSRERELSAQGFMGGANAILAARVSYFLDLRGPNIAIDTACSSSLVAIANACDSLNAGNCDSALAGGVCVMGGPALHIMASQAGMLSRDGRCYSFDQRANGFVPGEGVGVVLLKRLADAERDGDRIQAVIEGWGMNQDGKSNGITAPNEAAQAGLIKSIHQRFAIDPSTIQLVEAHGTGTKLGDPIEVAALKTAFGTITGRSEFCALGSVKSNIGHCMTAAGVAGFIKLILALKHKSLPPTVNFECRNEHIKIDGSPFYINDKLRPWDVAHDEQGRRAAVSSFGFGGTNAHIVLSEYRVNTHSAAKIPVISQADKIAVPLSARTGRQLRQKAQDLLAYIRRHEVSLDPAALAYTLQVGREPMEKRLGFLVDSLQALSVKLEAYLAGESGIDDLYQAKENQDEIKLLIQNQEMGNMVIEKWLGQKKLNELLELWVNGLNPDWTLLYGEAKPQRIELPVYPFSKDRYWVTDSAGNMLSETAPGRLHPLLHHNTSNLCGQRFSSTFNGNEHFLADHVVGGRPMLPGVAQLEMARAAIERSAEAGDGLRFKDIVWLRPLVVDKGELVAHLGLYPEEDGAIGYEVYSDAADETGEPVIHGQGRALQEALGECPTIDPEKLAARCNKRMLPGEALYRTFGDSGLSYGPAHRGVKHLAVGNGEVLARLSLPESVADSADDFGLHPSLMDAALQAVAGLSLARNSGKTPVPFALDEVRIWSDTPAQGWAWVRYSAGASPDDEVGRYDIDLSDDAGRVCVRMTGFSVRTLDGGREFDAETALLAPAWRTQAAAATQAPAYSGRWVVLSDSLQAHQAEIEAAQPGGRCLVLENDYQAAALGLIGRLGELMREKPRETMLIQVVLAQDTGPGFHEGLSGVLRTAQLENSKILGQVIGLEGDESSTDLIAKLEENALTPHDREIRYRAGERQVLSWETLAVTGAKAPWRDGGVYLITGGAGGLGLILAREIATRVKAPVLVLTSRSELSEARQAALRALEALGARVSYRQVDVTDAPALSALVSELKEVYGGLNGIVHCAGGIRDSLLAQKTAVDVREVLAPKVDGLMALDQASAGLDLDFMILFGSIAGALGNVGQADYAAGNAFMDGFAAWRNERVALGERKGRTLSVDWPLWRDGGMAVDEETARALRTQGVVALETGAGIQALYDAWAGELDRVLVISGDLRRLRKNLLEEDAKRPEFCRDSAALPASSVSRDDLPAKVQSALIQAVSKQLKVKAEEIDLDSELSEYGFDSISFTQFTNDLNQRYGLELRPMIVFEHPSLGSLAQHLVEAYGEVMGSHFAPSAAATAAGVEVVEARTDKAPRLARQGRRSHDAVASRSVQPVAGHREPIAVIGISGRFPESPDLEAFWRNLSEARDCIGEIPKERWDWQSIYGDPLTEPGKTNIKHGGFIEGVDEFDPRFFGLSPREAETMDPQQRLLMTYVWKALEDAGYAASGLSGSGAAIFAGMGGMEYSSILAKAGIDMDGYAMTGMVPSVGPNRLSYLFNFHGPSEPVETACSSSLVAIHRALQVLAEGECELAIAGGVNTLLSPDSFVGFSNAGMLSEDGRCKTFSNEANGYVRGEGVGVLVLKRLSAAEADGDHIYGVIRGSAVNHGGRTQSLTAPNPKAQAAVLQAAYRRAGVDPRTVSYIEAHGTGTALGDPIEIEGLKQAFAAFSQGGEPAVNSCGLGSVKSNIGHLELAAGMAGVIKVLLQMRHKQLVKSLHCEEVNPYIQLDGSPFYIVQEARPWAALKDASGRELPRRAGVSSFGFGGVNAHVVIEEYVAPEREPVSLSPALVVLSAKSEERLREHAAQLSDAIDRQGLGEAELADMAYTLQVGREAMEVRLGLLANSMAEVKHKLAAYLAGEEAVEGLYRGEVKREKESIGLLSADEDMAKAFEAWVAKGKYGKLLDLWVKGLPFDWNRLYGDEKPRRISLPSYPFAKERYWVKGRVLEVAPAGDLLEEAQTGLARIVSEKLKVPVEEIDLDSEFNEYGFDSISFTLFIHELNKRFGLELLPTTGFEYPTLGKLVRHLVGAHTERMAAYFTSSGLSTGAADSAGTVDKAAKSRWFARRKHNDAARLKLFCLPYAIGGGASVFHGWQERLPDDIEVCPIQLPGRESRVNEQPYDDLDTCVEALCEVLGDELDRPYAFYGHSGGGLIAYRLAFRLNQIHGRKPSHLFVGAYPSPGIQPNPMMERLHERFADAGFGNIFETNDLLNAVEAIQKNRIDALESVALESIMAPLQINAELYQAWLPAIIADRKMLQSYSWDGVRFDLPVTVFHGRDDEVVRKEEIKAWEAVTTGSFVYNQVAGDHLFIRDERILHSVVKHIGKKLRAR